MLIKQRKWLVKASHDETEKSVQVEEISSSLGITKVTSQLLINRGCTTVAEAYSFTNKETEKLYDPFLMKDMKLAGERILKAVRDHERIIIYGDYDVDGVTSVSILHMYLSALGADVGYYIPSRLGEGYGMSEASLRKLNQDGCSLIITVDTGITSCEEAEIINSLGMGLIITDHHECHTERPNAYAIINPKQPDCQYPFKELAGVGVVFKLLCALEALSFPDDTLLDCIKRVSDKYIDLVAIGTVADVMPLRDENRLIVFHGLHIIEERPRLSLEALFNASANDSGKSVQKRKITSGYIGFTIAPRVNAAGRIRSASTAVELFLCDDAGDKKRAEELSYELCEINKERQLEENKIIEEAFEKINAEHDFAHDPVIVLADESWHHGIIGIVASRITERYSRPCILISFDDIGDGTGNSSGCPEDVGKGSGRSIKGMNLVDALTHCGDLLVKYGGHELAAGLTIERGKLKEFKQRINDFARGCFDSEEPKAITEIECELVPSDINMNQAVELYKLEPYGVSNPPPLFMTYGMKVMKVSSVGGGKHTKLTLARDNLVIFAMCFRNSPEEVNVFEGDIVDVIFNLDINDFQNVKTLQLIVKDLRLCKEQNDYEVSEHELYNSINNGTVLPGSISPDEINSLIPDRNDFGAVYNLLKKEIRMDHDTFSVRNLERLMKLSGYPMRYVKLKYIIRVFQELNILGVDEIESDNEIYKFKYIYVKNKADLDKSNVLRKLKSLLFSKQ